MRLRTLVAGSTVAVLAAVGLPAAAHAAPVVPARALLTAAEFPAGSTHYAAGARSPSAGVAGSESAQCAKERAMLESSLRSGSASDAVAIREQTQILVSVIDRPLSASIAGYATRCATPAGAWTDPESIPSDLRGFRPRVVSTGPEDLRGWVDVRGATVGVVVAGVDGTAADREAFWQLLRAQVAKVERQP
ncbi:hypothetical protein HWD35_03380 [Tsukamurella tyrosinosolvens]|uniref:hypothetical protein n=2 Tax=Tsukamurella tyrosinosolvens TaxID=57704 RepID=UPI0007930245|nr:hypothetical protein [Tsukamurella tyrosinosolvens]KXP05669.1 hypothetical protein AXK59_09080 [Tsukamurella tyrosinosolvens]KZL95487.1 hypothetical protein AXX05_20105 [Tsukamurella tyrosinosolvens]MCA4993744.1 hypothetical protein [Tsukamurella tyrosinosolvens]QRY82954.1 hypothetical protein JVY00_13690 [Tsukamurella tyrosinosolvens]